VHIALGTAIGIAARALTGRAGRPKLRGGSGPIQNAVANFYRLLMGIYYRRVEAAGLANVPAEGPVLIVANHANAFIDGGMVAACLPRRVTLTARASLSQNPLNRVLLEALGIIQLHRAQDKDADMSANKTALAGAIDRLAEGGVLCLFPEGQSNTDPAMRKFRSGAARIALAYGERASAETLPDLTIVPAGLLYDDKSRLRSTALVEFGKPISLRQWLADQGNNVNPRALSETFFKAIAALVPQYARQRDAKRLPHLADLAARGARPPQPLGHPESRLVRAWHWRRRLARADTGPVLADASALRRDARRRHISVEDLLVPLSRWRALLFTLRELELLLIGLLPALWGALNYLPSVLALCYETRRVPRLEDQWATHFVIPALIVLPIFALIQTALVAALVSPLAAALYLATLPYFARVSLHYSDRARAAWRRAQSYLNLQRLPRNDRDALRQNLRDIVAACRSDVLQRPN
jgi:1-acyl-sn-glycerol-3-phosphate acyltransferase